MSSGPKNRIAQWLAGGLRTVMLPSGIVFAVKLPDAQELIVKRVLPPNLREIATRFQANVVNAESLDLDELGNLLGLLRAMVAFSLRYVWESEPSDRDPESGDFAWSKFSTDDDRWSPVTITAADLAEGTIDGDDYVALQEIVNKKMGIREITAYSLRENGLIDQTEFEQRKAGAIEGSGGALESFRGERGGARSGDAGAAVESRPGKPDRARRSRARVSPE